MYIYPIIIGGEGFEDEWITPREFYDDPWKSSAF